MFSTVTSACVRSSLTISSPRGDFRFSVSDFLLALNWWKYHGSVSGLPGCRRRPGSPVAGFSILTTSAPSQASDSVQDGPASNWVKSTTLTPSRQSSSTPISAIAASSRISVLPIRCARPPPQRKAELAARPIGGAGAGGTSDSAAHPRQPLLDQADEQGGAEGDGVVVEIVARVVHFAAALAVAVADLDVGARHALQHVGEILRRH